MRLKSPIAGVLLACVGLVSTSSCVSDPILPSQSELFNREFIKQFGLIDSNQDWNNATRGKVTVKVNTPQQVKVTTTIGSHNYLLADYSDVSGSRTIEFDMPRGVKDITVSAAGKSIKTQVGGSADFGNLSRAIWDDKEQDAIVKIARTPEYREISDVAIRSFGEYLPENHDNRDKVTQNFSYVANGPFIVYPVFWYTNSYNTLGIYYIKNKGKDDETMVYVPFYTNKIKHKNSTGGNLEYITKDHLHPAISAQWDSGEYIMYITDGSSEWLQNNKNSVRDFDEADWESFKNQFCKTFDPFNNKPYSFNFTHLPQNLPQQVKEQIYIDDIKWKIEEEDWRVTVTITDIHTTASKEYFDSDGNWIYPEGKQQSYPEYEKYANYLEDGLSIEEMVNAGFDFPYRWRSEGIRIDITPGTEFGMFIRAEDKAPSEESVQVREVPMVYDESRGYKMPQNDGFTRMYSQQKYNTDNMTTKGGDGQVEPAVHAATYYYDAPSGRTYQVLGFEDWHNGDSDKIDLNDIIFFIDSENPLDIPEIKDEDIDEPTPAEPIKWLIACEDLGMLDDFDFNDVVFEVEHVSGQKTATIRPLASGGTLEVYLKRDNGDGTAWKSPEWHSLFNHDIKTPVNVGGATGTAQPLTIDVPEDFSITSSNDNSGYQSNMGGFHLEVTRTDGNIVGIEPPGNGTAPQMFLIYQSPDKKWRWPKERSHITWGYPNFNSWKDTGSFTIDPNGTNWWDTIDKEYHLVDR
jgi:hypothetical protein